MAIDARAGLAVRLGDSRITSAILFCMQTAMLCWPAFLNDGAILFFDAKSYYAAGHAAIEKIASMMASPGGGGGLDAAVQQTRAARSAFYSLFAYLTVHGISFWAPIVIQAAATVAVLRLTVSGNLKLTLCILMLCLATTAPWTASTVMPDAFTPIMILAGTVLLTDWTRLTAATRILLVLGIAAAMVTHLSNPPIAVAMLAAAVVVCPGHWSRQAAFAAAIVLALGATLAVSVVGFRQWSLAPNAPPFLLARSLEDGPGRLWLHDHCPGVGYVMCQHLDSLNLTVDDFIWHDNGVYFNVSRDDAARLRAEDKRIYLAAALEHPWLQLEAIAGNTLRQLVTFGLRDFYIPSHPRLDGDRMEILADNGAVIRTPPAEPGWERTLLVPIYAVVALSVIVIVVALVRGHLSGRQKQFVALIVTGICANAFVAAFSEPAARYQARVIWLLPLATLMIALKPRRSPVPPTHRPPARPAPPALPPSSAA